MKLFSHHIGGFVTSFRKSFRMCIRPASTRKLELYKYLQRSAQEHSACVDPDKDEVPLPASIMTDIEAPLCAALRRTWPLCVGLRRSASGCAVLRRAALSCARLRHWPPTTLILEPPVDPGLKAQPFSKL